MRRPLVVGLLVLAAVGCGGDQEPVGGGGSGAPALRSLLTGVDAEPAPVAVTPTTASDSGEGFEHTTNALRVLGDDAELDALAVDCHQADLSSCDDLYVGAPADSLYEAYGATCGARIDQPTNLLCADVLVGPPDDLPSTGDAFLDELATQCAAGDLVDCDLLYTEADSNSEAERYGATCGGRLETDQDCAALVT